MSFLQFLNEVKITYRTGEPDRPLLYSKGQSEHEIRKSHEYERMLLKKGPHPDINENILDGIHAYKGDSQELNSLLRRNKPITKEILNYDYIKNTDDSMHHITSEKLDQTIHGFRGFGYGFNIVNMQPGHIFKDNGYTSVSLNRKDAKAFASREENPLSKKIKGWDARNMSVIAKIHIPAGTKGHYIEHPEYNTGIEEKEFVLHKGTHFRVLQHHHDIPFNTHIVHMIVHKQD